MTTYQPHKSQFFSSVLFAQICRFGVIGLLAAATQMGLEIFIVSIFHLKPLVANIFAFSLAFNVSYFGHKFWTFNEQQAPHQQTLRRFAVVALLSFVMNEGLFYLFLIPFDLYYPLALLIVLTVVPPVTFVTSKFWAFQSAKGI